MRIKKILLEHKKGAKETIITHNRLNGLGINFIPCRNYSFQEEKLKGREIIGLILLIIILILAMIIGGQTYPY
jgi:hypothetical protein